MSKPLYFPKGWRTGPVRLSHKVYIGERDGTYVKGRQSLSESVRATIFGSTGNNGYMLSFRRPENLYQSFDTSTPVSGFDQPVGRILDQSGRGNHFGQSLTTSRAQRKQDANGYAYLLPDGADDGYSSLASIDLTTFTCLTVVLAIESTASLLRYPLEIGTGTTTLAGTAYVQQGWANTAGRFGARYRATDLANKDVAPAASSPTVGRKLITTTANFTTNDKFLSANEVNSSNTVTLGGTLANAVHYLLARAGTSGFFDGKLYAAGLVASAAPLSAAQLDVLQRWALSEMGGT